MGETGISVTASATLYQDLRRHLFQGPKEELAFMLAEPVTEAGGVNLVIRDLYPVPSSGLDGHTAFHLSLTDEVRGQIIKWAWDANRCLVEAHSHLGRGPAMFSPYDLDGLGEFVPHVRWRLAGRPYAALVLTLSSFDARAWVGSGPEPHAVDALCLEDDGVNLQPTGLTISSLLTRANGD